MRAATPRRNLSPDTITRSGEQVGLAFYLTPDFGKLSDLRVWIAAASQIFYSLGIGWGT